MLPKKNRLHTFREIKSVQAGKSFFLPEFVVKYRTNKAGDIKFGFVVSTKIDKRATARNLIKRQMRAAVREMMTTVVPGYSILVSARPAAKKLNFHQVKKQLHFALVKIKALK